MQYLKTKTATYEVTINRSERELEQMIQRHNRLYWELGAPEISDTEFDALMRELAIVNPTSELLTHVDATVFGTPSAAKVPTGKPMLSLAKAYSLSDVQAWADSLGIGADDKLLIQPKYDGIAAGVEGGRLITRGDGKSGIDITDKLPLLALDAMPEDGFRGEIVALKRETPEDKHPRNYAAGLMRRRDIAFARSQGARLYLIDYRHPERIIYRKELAENWEMIVRATRALEYPTDGVVIKLADADRAERLGNTAHHPRAAIAFKFSDADPQGETLTITRDGKPVNNVGQFIVNCGGVASIKARLINRTQMNKSRAREAAERDFRQSVKQSAEAAAERVSKSSTATKPLVDASESIIVRRKTRADDPTARAIAPGMSGRRITLVKYADPESYIQIDGGVDSWTKHSRKITSIAQTLRNGGATARVVKIDAAGYFAWLGDRENTEAERISYADAIAGNRKRTSTDARKLASRANGAKGGRPRKKI